MESRVNKLARHVPVGQPRLTLYVVEMEDGVRVGTNHTRRDGTSSTMLDASVWRWMPQELMESVLLVLPLKSQARFHSVCKRWRDFLSSAAFREGRTALHPNTCRFCFIERPLAVVDPRFRNVMKPFTLKVELPIAWPPVREPFVKWSVASNAGLVGVASVSVKGRVRSWLLDVASQRWQELPPLLPRAGSVVVQSNMLLAGRTCASFQVTLELWIQPTSVAGVSRSSDLFIYSSTSTSWRNVQVPWPHRIPQPQKIALSSGGYVLSHCASRLQLWLLDGSANAPAPALLTSLPRVPVPAREFCVLSNPDCGSVIGYRCPPGSTDFELYRLDEGSGEWKCVVPGLPPWCPREKCHRNCRSARAFGNMVVIVLELLQYKCECPRHPGRADWLVLTYHISLGSYRWLHTVSGEDTCDLNLALRWWLWSLQGDPAILDHYFESLARGLTT